MNEFLSTVVAGPVGYVPAVAAVVALTARIILTETDTSSGWPHSGALNIALIAVTAVAFALLGMRMLSVVG